MRRRWLAGLLALNLATMAATAMAQQTTEDGHAVLLRAVGITHNVEPLLAFYRDMLGMTVVADATIQGGDQSGSLFLQLAADRSARFVQLRGSTSGMVRPPAGASDLAFIELPDAPPPPARAGGDARGHSGDTMLVHQVHGIDSIWARLQAAGVPVLIPLRTSPSGKSRQAIVVDPMGRPVEIYELNP